ncbi:hypothetical protein EV360DRAFT_36622 [Lentinula raphanica]|nr:hypothetical protein EV360DRAFT_36622 [Lentinula raphanica]
MPSSIRVLPGFYQWLFVYFEPISAMIAAPMIWIYPGTTWFHHEQIPGVNLPGMASSVSSEVLDPRTVVALWQLGNCYMLVGFIVSLVFRVTGDAFHDNPNAQERIVGAILCALAITDVRYVLSSFIGLPPDIRYNPALWNGITHGNITLTTFLFCARLAWFMGVGRSRFHSGSQRSRESVRSGQKAQ